MNNCNFVYTLPEYVLDRTVIINDGHEHRVSGFKLAKASEYFKRQLIQLRQGELAKSRVSEEDNGKQTSRRVRARSLCHLEFEPLRITYDDIDGFETMLSFTHCSEEARRRLASKLTSGKLVSILKAGMHFEVPSFMDYFITAMKTKLRADTIWDFWIALREFNGSLPNVVDHCMSFLLKNFLEASDSEHFLRLEVEQLKPIMKDDALNVANELELFGAITTWVKADRAERVHKLHELLECVRFGRLTAEEFAEITEHPLVKEAGESCGSLLAVAQIVVDSSADLPESQQAGDDTEAYAYYKRPRLPHSAIFVVGGWEGNQDDPNFGPSRAVQVYNSRSDTWRRIAADGIALDEGHAYSGCVLYKNKIYIVGGYIASGPTQTLKMLELTVGTWKFLSPMHEKRNYVCTCLLDNAIYAIGGHNGRHRLNTVERYDPEQNNWTYVSQMRQVRSDAGADSLNGRIYVCGGFDGHHFYDSVESYDPKVDQWTLVAPMQNIRSGVSVTAFKNALYAIGGNDGLQRLRTVEKYDPETNQWQTMPSMIRQRSNFCIVTLEDIIYVMGGWSDETNSTIALVEKWVPGMTSSWQSAKELFLPASANCCCGIQGLELIRDFL
nr:unnamed protein product [Spirometra erinaceieuropaei]